jgi:hypothetical protein
LRAFPASSSPPPPAARRGAPRAGSPHKRARRRLEKPLTPCCALATQTRRLESMPEGPITGSTEDDTTSRCGAAKV